MNQYVIDMLFQGLKLIKTYILPEKYATRHNWSKPKLKYLRYVCEKRVHPVSNTKTLM